MKFVHFNNPFVRTALSSALMALSFANSAMANTIVGSFDGGNCYPFSCLGSDARDRYQQIYSSAAFSGPETVRSISFFQWAAGPVNTATFDVDFYLTSVDVGTMNTSATSNLGTLLSHFGSFNVSGSMPVELTLDGLDFTYNPSMGNLLMDVKLTGGSALAGYNSFFQADYTGQVTQRAFGVGDNLAYSNATGALVTQFNTVPAVPEPESYALMVLGLGAVGAMTRRQRRCIDKM